MSLEVATPLHRVFSRRACLGAVTLAAGMIDVSHPRARPLSGSQAPADRAIIEDLRTSAFPFEDGTDDAVVPETNGTRFFARDPNGGPAFHMAPRGGKLPETTYQDRQSLLFVPKGFRPDAPAALVLFLHGNLATLARDVARRQRVPAQVEASHANVLLVAPQMASNALDSSAGNFWKPDFLDRYLAAAGKRLAAMLGGRLSEGEIAALPVVVVAYSGGYLPAAFSLMYSREPRHRPIAGMILLDALFGEEAKFADWIAATRGRTFFVSLYAKDSADLNAKLQRDIGEPFAKALPQRIGPNDVVFQAAPNAVHNDFVTRAATADPLAGLLARIDLRGLAGGRDAGSR